jgi:hypothetical protein
MQAETGYTDDVFQAKGNDTSMSFINISEDEWQPTKTIVRCSPLVVVVVIIIMASSPGTDRASFVIFCRAGDPVKVAGGPTAKRAAGEKGTRQV